MQIIIVYSEESEKDKTLAESVESTIKQSLELEIPINVASEISIREEDIVNYFYWKYSKEKKRKVKNE